WLRGACGVGGGGGSPRCRPRAGRVGEGVWSRSSLPRAGRAGEGVWSPISLPRAGVHSLNRRRVREGVWSPISLPRAGRVREGVSSPISLPRAGRVGEGVSSHRAIRHHRTGEVGALLAGTETRALRGETPPPLSRSFSDPASA